MSEEILQLSQQGVAGIMIALILLCGFLAWMLYKIISNHIDHSNKSFDKNTEALIELKSAITSNTEATKGLADEVRYKK